MDKPLANAPPKEQSIKKTLIACQSVMRRARRR
jgi:hypothetical protein